MDDSDGRFQIPGHQPRLIFIDRNAGIFSHCTEVVNSGAWFQPDPNVPSCSGASIFLSDGNQETREQQQIGWDLSVPHTECQQKNEISTEWQTPGRNPVGDDLLNETNSQIPMQTYVMSQVDEKILDRQVNVASDAYVKQEAILPVVASDAHVKQEAILPVVALPTQFVSVIQQTPGFKKSRKKSVAKVDKSASGCIGSGSSISKIGNVNKTKTGDPASISSKSCKKRSRASEERNSPSKKRSTSVNKSDKMQAQFADVALTYFPEMNFSSNPEETTALNLVKTPQSSLETQQSSTETWQPSTETQQSSIETPQSTKSPKAGRQEMVHITVKVMETPSKEYKNWYADFSCCEPDLASSSESPLKKKYAKTIKQAREKLGNKVWPTVSEAILVAEQVFGMKPVVKMSYRRPEGKPIMIRFSSQADFAADATIATVTSCEIEQSFNSESGQAMPLSQQQSSPNNNVSALQSSTTVTSNDVVNSSTNNTLLTTEVRIPSDSQTTIHDLSPTSTGITKSEQEIVPGPSLHGSVIGAGMGNTETDNSKNEDMLCNEDHVCYDSPPGSSSNPFYFINRNNFNFVLSRAIKTDIFPLPHWIRSKLDACGYLDVIRDLQLKKEQQRPFEGIHSYCYISGTVNKLTSVNTVYFRQSETRDILITMPTLNNIGEGQKFYMIKNDDEPIQTSHMESHNVMPDVPCALSSTNADNFDETSVRLEGLHLSAPQDAVDQSDRVEVQDTVEKKLFRLKQSETQSSYTEILQTETNPNISDVGILGSTENMKVDHLKNQFMNHYNESSPASASRDKPNFINSKKKPIKMALPIRAKNSINFKKKKPIGENSKIIATPVKSEVSKPPAKKGRPRKLDAALKVTPVSPVVKTATSSPALTKKPMAMDDNVRCRKWFPNESEQVNLYAVGKFLVLADHDEKPEVEVPVYRILMFTAESQLLKKFNPVDLNGRVFHHATDTFVPYVGQQKELFSKYRPVMCMEIHKSENGDKIIEIVKYFAVPKLSQLLNYIDSTKDLLSSMRLVTMMFARELSTENGFIEKRVSRTSDEFDENYASAWESIDLAFNERVATLMKEYGYEMNIMSPVRLHPAIKFVKAPKIESRKGFECTPCKSKGRTRIAITKVEFLRKHYDRFTFDNIKDTPPPPEDFGVCYTCRPRVKLLHKLLHHKWLVYAAVYSWICDLVGELAADEVLDVHEVAHHVFEEYEWQIRNFLEFQSVIAEADREIETLLKGKAGN